MRIDILTLFPKMFEGVLGESIIKRARKSGKVDIRVHNLRDWTDDKHKKVDDKPFGGGPGMVIKPQPLFDAVGDLKTRSSRIVLMTPQGKRLDQPAAKKMSGYKHIIIVCGHYEGIDERFRKKLATDEISLGDFVLTGGEIPAMALVDSVVRLVPDPFLYWLATSDAKENDYLDEILKKNEGKYLKAIEICAKERPHGLH